MKHPTQLAGIYHTEASSGSAYGRSLYDLMEGRLGTVDARGTRTELRPAADGETILVLLRDPAGKVLKTTLLRDQHDFRATAKGLSVNVPPQVGESGVTNLGIFAGSGSVIVMPAQGGGLLGRQTEFGAGFFGFFLPIAAAAEENYHWPAYQED